MKSILILAFLLCVSILLLPNNVQAIQVKKVRTLAHVQARSFNIASIMELVRRYEALSKTNFGAFLNGFFLGLIDRVVAAKAEPTCTENKFWMVIQCFVGGVDKTMDAYYSDVGNFRTLPDDAVTLITEAESEGERVLADQQVNPAVTATQPAENSGWVSWLQVGWAKIQAKAAQALEYIKGKINGFWTKAVLFFTSPLMKGMAKIAKCVAPLAWEEIKDPLLTAALTFLGVPFADKLKGIILQAPLIIKKLKQCFLVLKTALTRQYATTQLKYYTYGKATEEVVSTLKTLFDAARSMRRFRRIFRETPPARLSHHRYRRNSKSKGSVKDLVLSRRKEKVL